MNEISPFRGPLRPSVFRQPDSIMYADNCRELQAAARRGDCELHAWTRGSYPGTDLGDRLPGICTVGFWNARHNQNWGLARHCNEGFKIAWLACGRLDLMVDDVHYDLQQGQFIVIRPWQQHSIGSPHVGASRLVWILLDAGLRRPSEQWHWPDWMVFSQAEAHHLGQLLTQNMRPVWDGNTDLACGFEALPQILTSRSPEEGESRLKLAINTVMLSLIERMAAQASELDPQLSTSQHTVAIFLRRLPDALAEDWTLDGMAEECGLSRTRFADLCRQLTNRTPRQYLQHLRLEHARGLLSGAQPASVTDIAFACGFNSSQYFSNAYRKHFGEAPRNTGRAAQ